MDTDPITVELYDGTKIAYPAGWDAADVVRDLKQRGVRLVDIKNTIHLIPKGRIKVPLRHDRS